MQPWKKDMLWTHWTWEQTRIIFDWWQKISNKTCVFDMDQAPLINEASELEESLRSFVGKLPETEEVLKDCLVTAACNLEQRLDLRAQNYHSRRRARQSNAIAAIQSSL